jgi:NADPH-dependent 2,4-dienoyl-CoA reductase/sulfur reductase-like enzyme
MQAMEGAKRAVVVGGGFLGGLELASSFTKKGIQVLRYRGSLRLTMSK